MNKNSIFTLVFFLIFALVSAQDNSWTLTKCMETALQNNIEIKIRQLEIKKTEKAQNSVLNRMLPTINLYGEQGYNFGSTIDPSTNGRVSSNIQNNNFYLNARTNLIDFSAFANAQKDKLNIALAKADVEVIENEYKLQILESFYQVLYIQESLKIQKEQLKQASFNLDRITKEVAIGSKPQSDLYDIQLSFSTEEIRNQETEQLYAIKKTELFQLMNVMDVKTDEVVLEPYFKEATKDFDNALFNPKIKLAELNYQNSLNSIRLEKASNYPVLSAYYGYSTFYYKNLKQVNANADSFFDQLEDNKNQQVGMQLSIPIFNGFRNDKKISASKIAGDKAKLEIEKEKQQVEKQVILEEKNKRNYSQLQYKLIEKQKFARASFVTTQSKFTSGKVEAIVYSSVKNQSLSADFEVLKNNLQLQYIDLKISLLRRNQL
ncbi:MULTISPECIES: TolC family protein [unclassified Flavobacterium]|uniref:TolC family protein n=1 Tax=unclassified Flavobacterium TaxID=196869 RepID=UPI00131AD10D|nr:MULTISPECIES: TolC family protein [unclassified Flavobacterium]